MIGTDPPNPPNPTREPGGSHLPILRRKPHLPTLRRKPDWPALPAGPGCEDEFVQRAQHDGANATVTPPGLPQPVQQTNNRPIQTWPAGRRRGHPSVAAAHPAAVPPGSGPAPCGHLYPSQRRSGSRRQRHRPSRRRRPGAAEPARSLLGEHCSINLKPVIDLPAGQCPVRYHIPTRLREQLHLRYPADVFPYATAVSRRIDLDHTIPYLSPDQGGPPGQTRIGNLGPHTPTPPAQNLRRLAGPTTRTRHLALAITPPPDLPSQRHRHPPPRRHHLRHTIWRAASPPHDRELIAA